jgi:hypothetical protein
MKYLAIGVIALVSLLPLIIRNQTEYRKEQITKKANAYGIDLDLSKQK